VTHATQLFAELPRETETKLVVRSADPVQYVRRVWSLRNVSAFRLDPRRTLDLRDTYFDTPDRRLSKAGQSLRGPSRGANAVGGPEGTIELGGGGSTAAHRGRDALVPVGPLRHLPGYERCWSQTAYL